MPSQWSPDFVRSKWGELLRAAQEYERPGPGVPRPVPPIQEGPRPPLTIHPQVGPVEQMTQRALRERGLGPDAWRLAQQTPVRMVPMEQYMAEGNVGAANYSPDAKAITMGYYPGYMQDEGQRLQYAHELRHAYQGAVDTPEMQAVNQPGPDGAYMQNFNRWAAEDPRAAGALRSVQGGVDMGIYQQVDPWELDARMAADQQSGPDDRPMTYETIPPYMQPTYEGWWEPNAQPDAWRLRRRGWRKG